MCSISYSLENTDMKGEGGQDRKRRGKVKEGAYLYLLDNATLPPLRQFLLPGSHLDFLP